MIDLSHNPEKKERRPDYELTLEGKQKPKTVEDKGC